VSAPAVALLPAGETIEDFLDPLGLTFAQLRDELTGGWLFGYADALRRAGMRPSIVCVSRDAGRPVRDVHRPTGAALWRLPRPRVNALAQRAARAAAGPAADDPPLWARALRSPPRHAAWLLSSPVLAIARLARHERWDAMICQDYEQPRFDACVALGRALGIPVFGSFQGAERALSPLERPLRPLAIRAAAGLIAGPAGEVSRLRARYDLPPERVARIFNPLDTAPWATGDRATARAQLDIAPDAWVAAWHGRVERHKKGLDVLLDAWERVLAAPGDRPRVLLLVGTGRDAGWLRGELARHGWPGVCWVDRYLLDKSAIAARLAAADAYVFPSRLEGFPVAPVEAMACGLPVVAAGATGVADILEGGERAGGIVVPVGDAAALADALLRLWSDPAFSAALGERAAGRAEHAFSVEAVGAQLRRFVLERGRLE
jgi:glycosyltransferase involved in cell wall biosynthesis